MTVEYVQNNIRLPVPLKEQVQEAAKAAKRTLAAEVEVRLEQSFEVDIETARETLRFINMLHGGQDKHLDPLLTELGKALGIEIE